MLVAVAESNALSLVQAVIALWLVFASEGLRAAKPDRRARAEFVAALGFSVWAAYDAVNGAVLSWPSAPRRRRKT